MTYSVDPAGTVRTQAPGEKQTRERSTIGFPYGDLDDALAVASAIHSNVGNGSCTIEQLAAWLRYGSVRGGAFQTKVSAARIFGLVDRQSSSYLLTSLGRDTVDPAKEPQARALAFLGVPLYGVVYDRYKGHLLPPDVGLERQMVELGVAQKQADKARQAFQRSALQAGFFEYGRDRLVLPANVDTKPIEDVDTAQGRAGEPSQASSARSEFVPQSGGGGGGGGLHPFIQGLLQTLPPPGTDWSVGDQDQWLTTAKGIFGLIYPSKSTKAAPLPPPPPPPPPH